MHRGRGVHRRLWLGADGERRAVPGRDMGEGERVISLETAKDLKDAGLEWEPQMLDFHRTYLWGKPSVCCIADETSLALISNNHIAFEDGALWIPRLEQLLQEIEKRRYGTINLHNAAGYTKWRIFVGLKEHRGDSPEEAAAQALLFILNNGRKENE